MREYIPVALRREVRSRFNDRCAYCQTPESLVIAIFEIEHIVPRSSGGVSSAENLCLACPTCNRHKGTRQQVFDAQSEQWIQLFHPYQQKWPAHFYCQEDGAVLGAYSQSARVTIETLRMNRPELVRLRRLWARLGEFPPPLDD